MAVGIEKNVKYTIIGGPRDRSAGKENFIPNPSPEVNTTGWTGLNASVLRTFAQARSGIASFALTAAANGNMYGYNLTSKFDVVAGQAYSASAWTRANGATKTTRLYIEFFNASNVSTGQFVGSDVVNSSSGWTQIVSLNKVAPANSVTAYVIIEIVSAGIGEVHYFDDVMAVKGATVPSFFTGDTPGYYWTGDRYNSRSAQNGTRVVLNDSTDPDNIGVVTDITGLDSADVQESVEENIESDGATHGRFYTGRRPVVIEGLIYEHADATERNQMQQKLMAATNALRNDGTLIWQPSGYEQMYCNFRKQNRTAIKGNWNKEFQASLVCADPRILESTEKYNVLLASGSGTAGRSYDRSYELNFQWAPSRGSMVCTNEGDGNASPIIVLAGDLNNPAIQNVTTEQELAINLDMGTNDVLVIDFNAKTLKLNNNPIVYSPVDTVRSWWWDLIPGDNTIQLLATAFTGSPYMQVFWHDTWL